MIIIRNKWCELNYDKANTYLVMIHSSPSMLTNNSDFVIQTSQHYWTIPHNCSLLKLLIEQQNIQVSDLLFESSRDCHDFIKTLFLMALEDECQTQQPSTLADFARKLMKAQTDTND